MNDEFNEGLKKWKEEIEKKLPKLKADLELKIEQHGSIELMANIAMQEILAQNPMFHNVENPLSENAFLVFLLGIFLRKNNLKAGEPHPNTVKEVIQNVQEYFYHYKMSVFIPDPNNSEPTDSITFSTRNKKFLDDLNPHCYPNQKIDHVKTVFSPINDFLESKFGFTVNDAIDFNEKISMKLGDDIFSRFSYADLKVEEARKMMNDPKGAELVKKLEEHGITKEYRLTQYQHFLLFAESGKTLIINVKNFCKENNIKNEEKFKKYLKTFSCKVGEQFEGFDDLLSDNIIFYKPLIQLDDENYFNPKPDFLLYRLDSILEYLLNDEKINNTRVWKRYEESKSKYLESRVSDFFIRIFPEAHLHQNLFYNYEGRRLEIDLLVDYDNKIFLIESKSGHLPLSAKRGSLLSLKQTLKELVQKAHEQSDTARKYIKSVENAVFEDRDGNQIFTINSADYDEFFFINVTLENLGLLATNLKDLDPLHLFSINEYPWSVDLYDLDVVTDCILHPVYFIHYLKQRIKAQNENIFDSISEIEYLGYYFQIGNFHAPYTDSGKTADKVSLMADFFDPFEKHYQFNEEKPKITIPRKLEELILNMQKYHMKGFTKITSLLLDFHQNARKIIAKDIDNKLKITEESGQPDGFLFALQAPFDIGFTYYTSTTMKNFYRDAKMKSKIRKYQNKITRWAVIGRNVQDKKNFATFFLYLNYPWKFDEEMERRLNILNKM